MNHATTALGTGGRPSGGRRRFVRHFVEMVGAMLAGMVVLGGLSELLFMASGSSFSKASGQVQVLLMGLNMTVPMVGWMGYRGHDRARSAEMAASMIIPTLVAAGLAAAGVLQTGAALGVQHVVMIPAMLGVMLWRYEHYSHAHQQPVRR